MTGAGLGLLVFLLFPAAAAAHGEHGGAKPVGGASIVTVGGYQVELLSQPSPPARGQPGQLVAKVLRNPALQPVSGGAVLIGAARAGAEIELHPAIEETWAGSYAVPFTPPRVGPYLVRVALVELDGRRFESPLVVEFQAEVAPAPGLGATGWTLVALLAGVGFVALYAVALRARLAPGAGAPLNLLDVPWVHRALTSPALAPSLQIPMLALMGMVVFLGFFDVQDGGVNVATKLTWTIWWAGIIFTFVLVGRVWCVACPFGALNEWTARLAAPARRLPAPLRNLWWATGMFVLLTWADEQLGVVRSPVVTAWIVLFFAALAVAVGLVAERRSFCRYLCPIGGLVGIYSMTAPVELRAKDAGVCRADREQACYRGGEASQGCPMFEFPQSMDRNNYCTLCAECVKGCARGNLVLRFRALGKDLWASGRRLLEESYLAVALVGLTLIVTAQMLAAWPGWISEAARWLPSVVRTTLKPVTYLTVVESVVLLGGTLVVGPLLVLAAAALSGRLAAPAGLGLRRTFVVFGYMFVPVGLAVHLAHNLAHLLQEGGGIVPALQRAAAVWTPFSLGEPDWAVGPLAPAPVVVLLQMSVLVGFFVLSLVAGYRLALRTYPDPRSAGRAWAPMALLSLAFTVTAVALLAQPMAMRHGM